MSWQKISLSIKDVQRGKVSEIMHKFNDILNELDIAGENISKMALLEDSSTANNPILYFTPACQNLDIIQHFLGSIPTEASGVPSGSEIGYLTGDQNFASGFANVKE